MPVRWVVHKGSFASACLRILLQQAPRQRGRGGRETFDGRVVGGHKRHGAIQTNTNGRRQDGQMRSVHSEFRTLDASPDV